MGWGLKVVGFGDGFKEVLKHVLDTLACGSRCFKVLESVCTGPCFGFFGGDSPLEVDLVADDNDLCVACAILLCLADPGLQIVKGRPRRDVKDKECALGVAVKLVADLKVLGVARQVPERRLEHAHIVPWDRLDPIVYSQRSHILAHKLHGC